MTRCRGGTVEAGSFLHVLGVAKGGTTSLCTLLDAHPDVWLSTPKDLDDFRPHERMLGDGDVPPLDVEGHAARWPAGAAAGLRLSTVDTLFHPPTFAARFAEAFPPPSRTLVVLRDPVARLVSAYRYGRVLGEDPGGSADEWVRSLLAADQDGTPAPHEMFHGVRAGRYRDLLEPWVEAYGARLGVVFTGQLRDRSDLARRLGGWLGLDPDGWPASALEAAGASNVTRTPRWRILDRAYRRVVPRVRPVAARFPWLLRARDAYWRVNRGPDADVPSEAALAEVQSWYDERNRGLGDLLDRVTLLADERPDWVHP